MGIDGGCFESIQNLLHKNKLPNIKYLITNGFSANLEVTTPHTTIPSWPCLFSGLNEKDLGYITFINPMKGIFNSFEWRKKSIFSLNQLKMFILNVPGTYPAWEINGEMITGILSPSISCFPKELVSKINKDWIIEGRTIVEIFKAFNMKKELFLSKLRENFDLLVYVIRVPDAISHRVTGSEKFIKRYLEVGYQKIDEFVGQIIEKNDYDNIFIFSDHGLKFFNKVIHFPRFLEKKKLLYLNKVDKLKINSILLKFYDIIRPFIEIRLIKNISNKLFFSQKRNIELKKKSGFKFETDKLKTHIVRLTSNVIAIYLRGKDKDKKSKIKNVIDKDKHVDHVIEYNIDSFPDLIVILKDKYIVSTEPSFFLKRKIETYSHSAFGFFIAQGKNIEKGNKDLINYQSIAPTIIKLYNIKKPEYMKKDSLNILKNTN